MTRRKGERTARMNERDFPHVVEIAIEPRRSQDDYRAWGERLDAMLQWHHDRGVPIIRGSSRREEQKNYEYVEYFRWCYADAATADAFNTEFGGEIVPPTKPGRKSR